MSFKLMVHAWDAEVPTQSHRLVLMKLVDCCDDDGRNIFPALATVAEKAMCSTRHVRRVIAEFCRIGLLRRLKAGGNGPGSTACYEMDTGLLASLRRAEMYPALLAAAVAEPLADEDESHAPDAYEGGEAQADPGPLKADHESALGALRRTPETDKADKLSPPTPYRPLKPEREGARAQADRPASSGDAPDAGHAADAGGAEAGGAEAGGAQAGSGEARAGEIREPATLAAFRQAYPHAGADDQAQLVSAWEALPFPERWPAIDGIPGFVAERKAAGFSSRLSAPKYLSGRNWRLVPAQVAERARAAQAGAIVEVQPWSKPFWGLVFAKLKRGQPIAFSFSRATEGKPLSAVAADMPGEGALAALQPYRCDGPEIEAWRPWLAARGARLPSFSGDFRVFLPGPTPPGGRKDEGDDDVRF